MKLYLSSNNFGDNPSKLTQLASNNRKAFVIFNALDFSKDLERRKNSEKRQLNELKELGFNAEILDLRDYFGNQDAIQIKLKDVGLLWVIGGNSFLLRNAMDHSGLAKFLIENKFNPSFKDFIYAGYSAGVCILGPTLKGIDIMDSPDLVKEIYNQEIIWDGVGLIDFSIVPHYMSDHKEAPLAQMAVDYFIENSMPYKTLSDGDVIISNT